MSLSGDPFAFRLSPFACRPVAHARRTGHTPHRASRAVQIKAPNSMIA
jgi:hypothetical protein